VGYQFQRLLSMATRKRPRPALFPGIGDAVVAERPRLWAVIDEAVIHRVVGGVSVMRPHIEVEEARGMTEIDLSRADWRKSSYSGQ